LSFYSVFILCYNLWISYGLLRSWKKESFGLREKMMYPQWLYYLLLTFDIPLRFTFVIALVVDPKTSNFLQQKLIYSSWLICMSLIQRFTWFVLTVENENVNNYEKFRAVQEIPELTIPEEDD
jgi:hypothetical protein